MWKPKNDFLLLLAFGFLLNSCKTYSEDDKANFEDQIQAYVKKSGIAYTKTSSGLYVFVEKKGAGDLIKYTDEVSFTYTGKLLDGKTFDQKFSRKPIRFPVKDLIMAWQEVLLGAQKGAKIKLIAPPYLAYGDHNLEDIPAHSILQFEIEVIDVH